MQLNYTISVISKCTHLILVERSDHDQTWLDYIHILRVTEQIIKIKLIINLKCRCIIVNQFLINTSFFFVQQLTDQKSTDVLSDIKQTQSKTESVMTHGKETKQIKFANNAAKKQQ